MNGIGGSIKPERKGRMKHELKIEKQHLENLLSGKKKAEVRYNDRYYQVGDILEFGRNIHFLITHIHSGLGMKEPFVVLSVERTKG